jgi:hypothetical protein
MRGRSISMSSLSCFGFFVDGADGFLLGMSPKHAVSEGAGRSSGGLVAWMLDCLVAAEPTLREALLQVQGSMEICSCLLPLPLPLPLPSPVPFCHWHCHCIDCHCCCQQRECRGAP